LNPYISLLSSGGACKCSGPVSGGRSEGGVSTLGMMALVVWTFRTYGSFVGY